jgi:hypothetical protein
MGLNIEGLGSWMGGKGTVEDLALEEVVGRGHLGVPADPGLSTGREGKMSKHSTCSFCGCLLRPGPPCLHVREERMLSEEEGDTE